MIVPNARASVVATLERPRPAPNMFGERPPWLPLRWRVELDGRYSPTARGLVALVDGAPLQVEGFAVRLVEPIPTRVRVVGRVVDGRVLHQVVGDDGHVPTAREIAAADEDLDLVLLRRERANRVMPPEELLGRLADAMAVAYDHRNSDVNWWALRAVLKATPLARSQVWRCLNRYGWTWDAVRDVLAPAPEKQGTKLHAFSIQDENQRARTGERNAEVPDLNPRTPAQGARRAGGRRAPQRARPGRRVARARHRGAHRGATP